jgi:NADH-quinone oxidoreductase E subunit
MTKFAFNKENLARAEQILAKYPEGRKKSALLPLLDIAQRQSNNWLPKEVLEYVADFISVPYIHALEVASFYTMFNLEPVGQHFIQVCGTTPCWLRGADEMMKICTKETAGDPRFTVKELECLGACVNAPIVQINDDYYEDLTPEIMHQIINDLKMGKEVKHGSQIGRICSAPRDFVK